MLHVHFSTNFIFNDKKEQFPDRRLYHKYTFTSARDGRAVLRVKSLEQAAWRAEELTLHLPPETQWIEVTSPHHQ